MGFLIIISVLFSLNLNASQAVGFYSRGKIKNSEDSRQRKTSFQKLFTSRAQFYSTQKMFEVLDHSWTRIKTEFPKIEKMQVGDLSSKKGGKIRRHQSHQNGLDADIVYFRNNGYVQPSSEPEWKEDFINGSKPSKNFNVKRNWRFIEILMEEGQINRIFVDSVIKRAFCKYALKITRNKQERQANSEILRRLRPAKYHRTHLHVRLKCPKNHKRCRKQSEPSPGHGCYEAQLRLLENTEKEGC
jgi:penicillin-insensitive murein DD-endopeptidase